MSSSGEKDSGSKTGASKEMLDLYDGTDDLLDYGDTYDLDTELLDIDLAEGEEFDLGPEDDLLLNAPETSAKSDGTEGKDAGDSESAQNGDATNVDVPEYANECTDDPTQSTSTSSDVNDNNTQVGKRNDQSVQNQPNQGQRDGNFGGYNRQLNNGRPPYSASSPRGGHGRGGPGGMRGRGQGYMGMGRGNFQGGAGMGHHSMMGMNMGMNMGMGVNGMGVNPAMAQGMNLGVNMNMNMGMMGMAGAHFPGDGYGNQGMGYPYGRGSGMDANRMNPDVGGMNVRGPGVVGQGRTIHINPKFQNRVGIPPIAGQGIPSSDRSQYPQQQQQQQQYQQQQRSQSQDSSRGQSRAWESKSSSLPRDDRNDRNDRNDDRYEQRHSGRDDRGSNYDRSNNLASSRSPDRGTRDSGDSYRPLARSDRDERSASARSSSDRTAQSDMRRGSPSQQQSSLGARGRSPHGGGITSRLGLKRSGEGLDDSYKAHKSSGVSTPRGEQTRASNTTDKDTESVSFLRDKRGPTEFSRDASMGSNRGGGDANPKGFVKMENVPESLSDASIRKLADGISGVDRVLTISKKGDRIVTLGFASVDEAKFFRRQINRTTIEGSLVTVTLASS
ncbi:hypothetical protein BGZ80_004870 [Entomortierella chlamydospora]|uniref:RRM domain-containing protein n=1 Tax=Entomortierella chlamydospora TaxID=101097 RepID=A0A9P6T2Y3_9FUNG|nr:hypothetical protein BGZ80_004870 [Entomortierella chlamydospora]